VNLGARSLGEVTRRSLGLEKEGRGEHGELSVLELGGIRRLKIKGSWEKVYCTGIGFEAWLLGKNHAGTEKGVGGLSSLPVGGRMGESE